jgi:dTDP-4-amino-4,6-dideoxygalactose transaminase
VNKLRVGFGKMDAIIIPKLTDGGESSYWWWRLEVDTTKLSVSKAEFCDALLAEGVLLNPKYDGALPHRMEWFKNKSVFGTSQLPWSSDEYKGDNDGEFLCPNITNTMDKQFNLTISESWSDKEINSIITAFEKVINAFSI